MDMRGPPETFRYFIVKKRLRNLPLSESITMFYIAKKTVVIHESHKIMGQKWRRGK
jgi:hypothetical protein